MQIDLFGRKRFKINLHMHTSFSDGDLTAVEAAQYYLAQGYDAIALTDHWFFGDGGDFDGMTILSGGEYNVGGNDGSGEGVYHVVGVGMSRAPSVSKSMNVQEIIDRIRAAGGIAILAHPAWSLNTPEKILALRHVDATEIYNSVSGVHHSRRADSSLIVDMLGCCGRFYPLIAADDTHYYEAGEACASYIMAEAEDNSPRALLEAIRSGAFYATQGPEVHLFRDGDGYTVKCSSVSEIVFFSNLTWSPRVFTGNGLECAHYVPRENERFLRVQVKDSAGRLAWTNFTVC
ncbi:MAG: hypothetical protein E7643_01750 [Ruminococcaceae bacterium]|nr:hypothetical protein [Oscillospiraceae bacterium]